MALFFELSLDYYQVKCCMERLNQKNNISGRYQACTICLSRKLDETSEPLKGQWGCQQTVR